MTAISATERLELPKLPAAKAAPEPIATRPVIFDDGAHDTPVYDRATLRHGHVLSGPAVIEEAVSVTVLRPGQKLAVDPYGNLLIGKLAEELSS